MALLESQTMSKGHDIIPFQLPDIDNKSVSSSDFSDVKALLIVFTCNHCPYAIASWPVLIDLQNRYGSRGLQIVAVNPNNNPAYPDDSHDKMKPYVAQHGINFPYLFDGDQQLARAYGAVCTPDPYLFVDGKLAYHGRLNDNWQQPAAVTEHSLELRLQSALGDDVALPQKEFPSMGCSIKWVQ